MMPLPKSVSADDVPAFAFWELVAVPVLFVSSWPWAAPPTTALVPAPNSAAPNAAATAFRMFMCFLAFLVESSPVGIRAGLAGTIATPGTVRQRNAVEISRVVAHARRRPWEKKGPPLARTKGGPFQGDRPERLLRRRN